MVARTASPGNVLVWDSNMALIGHKDGRWRIYEAHMRMNCVYNPWRYGSNYIISSIWDQNEKVLGGSHFVLQTIGAIVPLNIDLSNS